MSFFRKRAVRIIYSPPKTDEGPLSSMIRAQETALQSGLQKTISHLKHHTWTDVVARPNGEGELIRWHLYQVSEDIKPDEEDIKALEAAQKNGVDSGTIDQLKKQAGISFFKNFRVFFKSKGMSDEDVNFIIDIFVSTGIGVPFLWFGQIPNFVLKAINAKLKIDSTKVVIAYVGYDVSIKEVKFTFKAPVQKMAGTRSKEVGQAHCDLCVDLKKRTFSLKSVEYDFSDQKDLGLKSPLSECFTLRELPATEHSFHFWPPKQKQPSCVIKPSIQVPFDPAILQNLLKPMKDKPSLLSSCQVKVQSQEECVEVQADKACSIDWKNVVCCTMQFNRDFGGGEVKHYLKDSDGYEKDDYVLYDCNESNLFYTMQLIAFEKHHAIDIKDVESFCGTTGQSELFTVACMAAYLHGLKPYMGDQIIAVENLDGCVVQSKLEDWYKKEWIEQEQADALSAHCSPVLDLWSA